MPAYLTRDSHSYDGTIPTTRQTSPSQHQRKSSLKPHFRPNGIGSRSHNTLNSRGHYNYSSSHWHSSPPPCRRNKSLPATSQKNPTPAGRRQGRNRQSDDRDLPRDYLDKPTEAKDRQSSRLTSRSTSESRQLLSPILIRQCLEAKGFECTIHVDFQTKTENPLDASLRLIRSSPWKPISYFANIPDDVNQNNRTWTPGLKRNSQIQEPDRSVIDPVHIFPNSRMTTILEYTDRLKNSPQTLGVCQQEAHPESSPATCRTPKMGANLYRWQLIRNGFAQRLTGRR